MKECSDVQDACCSATTWKQMTNDVDFGAVSQGTKHKWFLKGARKLFERDAPRPVASHGCSASLASVHRRAPPLACAYVPPPLYPGFYYQAVRIRQLTMMWLHDVPESMLPRYWMI